jgi:hypothetical protein
MINKKNDNGQTRLMAVMALSFTFFIVYDYFFIPKNTVNYNANNTIQAQSLKQQAPILQTPSNNDIKTISKAPK